MPDTGLGTNPWDHGQGNSKRSVRENIDAYRSFRLYLEMGRDRSHARLSEVTQYKTEKIKNWSARYCWAPRAAAYDAHQISLWSSEARQDFEDSHKKELVKFKHDQQVRAEKLGKVADQLIQITSETLSDMIANGEPIESQQLAAVARTAAALAEAAMNTAATALGVDDLIEAIEPEQQ